MTTEGITLSQERWRVVVARILVFGICGWAVAAAGWFVAIYAALHI